jgi:hypothetical protein
MKQTTSNYYYVQLSCLTTTVLISPPTQKKRKKRKCQFIRVGKLTTVQVKDCLPARLCKSCYFEKDFLQIDHSNN